MSSKSNRRLKTVTPVEEPKAMETTTEPKPEVAKAEAKPDKKSATRAEKSEWKVELKKALFADPTITNDRLCELVVRTGYPSVASVVYARAETLHTLDILKKQKLYLHPGL